jgi:hypothetical protein
MQCAQKGAAESAAAGRKAAGGTMPAVSVEMAWVWLEKMSAATARPASVMSEVQMQERRSQGDAAED